MLALPLSGAAAPAAASRQAQAPVAVIIYLKEQPFAAEAAAQRPAFAAQAAAVLARLEAEAGPGLPAGDRPRSEAEEIALAEAGPALSASDQSQLQQALSDLDTLLADQRRQVFAAAQPAAAASQAPVEALIARLGGTVTARLAVVNALGARLPPAALAALQRHPAVAEVVPDTLAKGALETSPLSLRADSFWNEGYTGGVLDLAVVDTGVDIGHPALAGHRFEVGRFLTSADSFNNGAVDPAPDDLHGHGTHVAGIAGSTAVGRRGVAYGFDTLLNAKAAWDNNGPAAGGASLMYASDSMDAIEWAVFEANEAAEVVNLSFAGCTTADDTSWARFFDAAVDASGVTAVVAAGNSTSGCTRVTDPSIAFNALSVANVDDQGTTDRAGDAISPNSNVGPTYGNRRKPDLAAPGTNINSANAAWEGAGADYLSLSGTSMAAPHMAGAALLLMQAGVTDPRAIKAILINSAEDKGTLGWDPNYGWGYVDLSHASAHRGDSRLGTVSPSASYQLYKGPALENDRATLVWNRHVTYPCATTQCSQWVPVTNLDLALYAASSNALLDTSAAAAISDTVEQVQAPAASALNVVRVGLVTLNGALSQETFALATEEGFTPAIGPVLADGSSGHVVPVGQAQPVTVRLVNSGDLPAHGVVLTVTVPSGLGLPPGPQVFNVGFLDVGAAYTVPFTATLQQDEARLFTLNASAVGYGNTYALTDTVGLFPLRHQLWVAWTPLP